MPVALAMHGVPQLPAVSYQRKGEWPLTPHFAAPFMDFAQSQKQIHAALEMPPHPQKKIQSKKRN